MALQGSSNRWVTTTTKGASGRSLMHVHFNILDGSLLVDGIPLSRLPLNYETHATYRRLFGDKILEVVPSSMTGMVFEMRHKLHDRQVHLAMYDEELVIRTSKLGEVHELLPTHALQHDFPRCLITDYFHWLNTATTSIEWRPQESPWDAPSHGL